MSAEVESSHPQWSSSSTSPAAGTPGSWVGWSLVALVALGLALRMPWYTESVWLDELFTSRLYCGDLVILMKTLFSDTHPPAYFIFIHFWISVFGDSEIWLRMPPLLCGLMSIVLIARVGAVFGGSTTGVIAAFLLAVSPVHIWYSQEGRPYSTTIFLVLLTTLAFYRLSLGQCAGAFRRIGWRMVFFFGLLGGVFTHYYVAAFPVVLLCLTLFRKCQNRKTILLSCVTVLALIGGYMGMKMYLSHVPTEMHYLRSFDLHELWLLFFQWFLTGNGFNPIDNTTELGVGVLRVVQAMGVALALLGVFGLFRRPTPDASAVDPSPRAPGLDVVIWMLVVPALLLVLTAIGKDKTYVDRSALPSLPFFLILLSMGMTVSKRRFWTGTAFGMAASVSAVVLASQVVNRANWTVYKPNPDWRTATAYLSSEIDDSTGELHLYSEVAVPAGLTYYDPRIQQAKHFAANEAKLTKLVSRVESLFGKEGFPAESIQAFIHDRVESYERILEDTRKTTRMWTHYLDERDPLLSPTRPQEFWLLVYHGVSERVQAIVDDPKTEVLADRAFPSLRVYRVRVKPD